MDLVLARQKKKIRTFGQDVETFAINHLADHVIEQDTAAAFLGKTLDSIRSSGLLGIELTALASSPQPRACPPRDGNFMEVITAIRILSRIDPSAAVLVHVHNALVCRLISKFGSEPQKTQWLPLLVDNLIGAFAATERHAGSDLSHLHTTVTTTQTGFVLNGEKHWITNAKEAGLFIVFAQLDGAGMAAFLVPADALGVTVGPRLNKMSVKASSTCTVTFNNVVLPHDALLGGSNTGMDVAMYGLVCGRIGIAAQMLGIAEGALEIALSYARERQAFGEKIINHQGIAFPLAQASTEISAAALMVEDAATRLSNGGPHMLVSERADKAKLFASQVAERVTSLCVEVLGGNGVAQEYHAERFFRDAKVGKIYEGTVNVLLRSIAQTMID